MATIKDVAKRAGVSMGTASNVIRGSATVKRPLRERVEEAIRDLGFQPNHAARSLKSSRSHTLGMVISDITNPFFPLLVRGAEDAALEHGYLLNTFNTDDRVERERTIFSMLRQRRVDGVMAVVAPSPDPPAHLQHIMDTGVPLVCLDRMPADLRVDSVLVDNVRGAAMCVRHLISMGHRTIGVISGSPSLQTAQDRVAGYRLALSESGIPFNSALIREGNFRPESGHTLTKDLCLSIPVPTALFVTNGTMGMGALKAVQELGLRCPQDIALAVFDDVPGADVFRPQLTVVSQPAYQMGYQGTGLLIQRITGHTESTEPIRIVLQPELKIRESTNGARPRTETAADRSLEAPATASRRR
jgi:LacI family transcriptional regulator